MGKLPSLVQRLMSFLKHVWELTMEEGTASLSQGCLNLSEFGPV